MEDIKVIEPKQEIVEVPQFDTFYLPFARYNNTYDWVPVATTFIPTTIDQAKKGFNGWIGYEKMILKVQLPAQHLEDTNNGN